MVYTSPPPPVEIKIEVVIVCVGFDEILDITLTYNHGHFDTVIVVTTHADQATHAVANKHGAILVQSDLFYKNGRKFNKGAAINAGFNRFQYYGWRMVLDADILLPATFRRLLLNHTHLDTNSIYGADRVDIVGPAELRRLQAALAATPQHSWNAFVNPTHPRPASPRYLDRLHGYVPIGFFQLWHATCQKEYPWSLGTAAHDDVAFATQWPENSRRLLPSMFCYHLCAEEPKLGENWEGRRQPRFSAERNLATDQHG
jgi:hypothetical protein